MSKQTVDGYAYQFGERRCASLDRVVGSRACKIELAPGLAVREVVRRVVVDEAGEPVALSRLLAEGRAEVVEGSLGAVERNPRPGASEAKEEKPRAPRATKAKDPKRKGGRAKRAGGAGAKS